MRKLVIFVALMLLFGCTKTPNIEESLASFAGTRSTQPLVSTIWEHETGEVFNRYIIFSETTASIFYGLIDDGELQRWSPFYSAPYWYKDGLINTLISFPLWGENRYTYHTEVIRAGKGFTLDVDGDTYHFLTTDSSSIQSMWMILYANITPWE